MTFEDQFEIDERMNLYRTFDGHREFALTDMATTLHQSLGAWCERWGTWIAYRTLGRVS